MRVILGKLNNELLHNLATGAAPFCTRVDAAVAYANSKDHPLVEVCRSKKLRLTFYGLFDEDDAVSPALLKELLAWGPNHAEARLVKRKAEQKWRAKNRERLAAYDKAWQAANRERVAANKRAYYVANRDRINAKRRAARREPA